MSESTTWYCQAHNLYSLEPCPFCVASAAIQRDVLNLLEARIADLETRLLSTNRQLAVQQQIALDLQRAHNATVPYVTALAAQAGLLP